MLEWRDQVLVVALAGHMPGDLYVNEIPHAPDFPLREAPGVVHHDGVVPLNAR